MGARRARKWCLPVMDDAHHDPRGKSGFLQIDECDVGPCARGKSRPHPSSMDARMHGV